MVSNKSGGEIILRDKGLCNLSEVVVRANDTLETLRKKVKSATMFGVWQATLTTFPYVSESWKVNADEERLLGVSLTGIMDNPVLNNVNDRAKKWLADLKGLAISECEKWCNRLGINMSAAITCVKPSGCRPWYSLTSTNSGLLTLQEMFVGHPDGAVWSELGQPVFVHQGERVSEVTKTYNNGVAEVFRVRMNYGLTVDSTANHKWFVTRRINNKDRTRPIPINDWVRTDQLQEGDVLDVSLGAYKSDRASALHSINELALSMRADVTAIKQPDTMSEDLAWFLGYLWGDGAMSPEKYRIRFSDERLDNLYKASGVLESYFNVDAKVRSTGEKLNVLEVGSKMLWHWLIRNGVYKYFEDRIDLIPECVRRSSRSHIVAFLAGLLDSDGWVGQSKSGKTKFTFTTADPQFAKHLQDVAWAVGLGIGCSHNKCGDNFQQRKSMYLLCGSAHMDAEVFDVFVRNSTKLQRAFVSEDFKQWHHEEPGSQKGIVGKVLSIEPIGAMPTFDIEVKDTHWYYAGAVKSHNSVSQLVDCASGIHQRYASHYIRRYRISTTDPLFRLMKDQGVPWSPEVGQDPATASTMVLEFPIAAPKGAKTRHDFTAMQQLEHWRMVKEFWCEHNPSITVYVGDDEWLDVGAWVYKNFDDVCGVSFLPRSNHVYQLSPYEEITPAQYADVVSKFPKLDFSKLSKYEEDDNTEGSKSYGCLGDKCEI